MPQVVCLSIFVTYAYSHPRLCITTVRPTVHATNAVIEEAEQELSVRLPDRKSVV